MATMLPTGGNHGYVQFVFPDGWTIFLTSANGASDFPHQLVTRFDVTERQYYGSEYDIDLPRARRLLALANELEQCRRARKPVVLHCNHGRSRSVIALGAYLIYVCGANAIDALRALEAAFTAATVDRESHYHRLGNRVETALFALENFRHRL